MKDLGDKHYLREDLAVSLDEVKNNFRKYHLLNDQVKLLKGWFKDTILNAPIEKSSLLRLAGVFVCKNALQRDVSNIVCGILKDLAP